MELVKSKVEPYLHSSVEQVQLIFGRTEAQRKILFEKWWKTLTPEQRMDATGLEENFNTWFEANRPELEPIITPPTEE